MNRLTHAFSVEYPIFGGPMGGVAGPELVGAVSNAGGLGLLGHANLPPDEVRQQIRQTKSITSRPFGIGLLFPSGSQRLAQRDGAKGIPSFLQQFADGELAEPPVESYSHELAQERLSIAIEEGVKVLSLGLGAPAEIVSRAHEAGMKVISLIGSLRAAKEVEAMGVDAVVAQGHEAGGHTGRTGTMVLVPQVTDALSIPVIAAGGIVDGRSMAAAMILGAQGVLLGTSLIATPEARTHEAHKRRMLELSDDETVVSRCYTGKPSRVIRNAFVDAWRGHEDEILPMPAQWERVAPIVIPAKQRGSLEVANWPTGQCAVRIDRMRPAGEVVRDMATEAKRLLEGVPLRERE